MLYRNAMSMLALAAVLAMSIAGAKAFDYPDWSGSWLAGGGPARGSFDP
jgi:hypothetical protein